MLREGLGRAAFLVRIAALTHALGPVERAAFWVGAVIADDARWLATNSILGDDCPLWIGGRQPQRALYGRWLGELRRGPVQTLDDALAEEASAQGAVAVALRWLTRP